MASPAAGETASRKKLIIFDAEEDLAASLAKYTAELSAKLAAERGAFTVVLSGGSLVKALRFRTRLRPRSSWFPDRGGALGFDLWVSQETSGAAVPGGGGLE
jgi:hypothetical protein